MFYCQAVSVEAFAGNHALARSRCYRGVALFLAGKDVADVHLDGGCWHCSQSIGNGEAVVAVGASVNHYAIGTESHAMYLVDDASLAVALEEGELHLGVVLSQLLKVAVERLCAINLRLAPPNQVQVRTIDDRNLHDFTFCFLLQKYQ